MKSLALSTALLTAAVALGAQATQRIPVTTVATLATDGAGYTGGMVESPGGKLLYYTSVAGIHVYDRVTKSTAMTVKGDFGGQIVTSAAGDWLVMTRGAEGAKSAVNAPQYIWTIPVNPRTGIATGEPRRLSATPAEAPAFSPDGKWIAFIATGNPRRMIVIPATGGQERVLFERNRPSAPVSWSPDGKWIYSSQFPGAQDKSRGVLRVSVDGGTPTLIKAAVGDLDVMAPDGRHIVGISGGLGGLSAEVSDMNGVVIDSMTPLAPLDGVPCGIAWANDGLKALLLVVKGNSTLQLHALDATSERTITLGRNGAREPSISPDGRFVAVAVHQDTGWAMAIVNADGSNQRVIQPLQQSDLDQAIWAPDSKHFAFVGAARHAIYTAEAATGQVTKVGSADLRVGDYRWLPDSRTLMYNREDGTSTKMAVSVHATSPDGRDRVLRDLTPLLPVQPGMPWYGTSWFLGDSAVVVIRLGIVIPIHGGAARTLYASASPTRTGIGATTAVDGSWIARRSDDSTSFEIFAADGKPGRVLRAPAGIDFGQLPYQQTDPRAIIASASTKPNGPTVIYRIPLDGSAPKALITIPFADGFLDPMLSTDGKRVIYVRNAGTAITVVEADLGARVAKPPVKH